MVGFLRLCAISCKQTGGGSASGSSQRECVLTVANKVRLSTRRVYSTTQRRATLYFASLVAVNRA
nr:hypothetical protein [uncultured Campylobacter sp.]